MVAKQFFKNLPGDGKMLATSKFILSFVSKDESSYQKPPV
jgi:hypothetical protein